MTRAPSLLEVDRLFVRDIRILAELDKEPAPTQMALALRMEVPKGWIYYSINKLITMGLVEKKAEGYYITMRGRLLLESLRGLLCNR